MSELIEKLKAFVERFGRKRLAAFLFIVLFTFKETFGRKLYCWLRNYPPLVLPFPILGNFPYLSPPLEPPGNHINFLNLSKKYGPVYSLYFGSNYGIVLNDRDSFYEALRERQDDYARRPFLPSFEMITHGAGVAMNNGKRWRMIRTQMMQRATNKQKGVDSEPIIVEEVNASLHWLYETKCKVGKGNDFDLRLLLRKESLNIAMRYLYNIRFGEEMSADYFETQDWIRIIFEHLAAGSPSDFMPIFRAFENVPFLGNLNKQLTLSKQACLKMENFIDKQIVKHKAHFQGKAESEYDFIDHMLKAQEEAKASGEETLTDIDIRVCCWDAMAGQIDTSATTMEWIIYTLINHKEVQQKAHAILDEVVGPNRLPNLEDIPKLEYITAIIDEIFRWRHFAPQGLPHEAEKDTKMLGYNVPKGAQVFLNFHSLHMNPAYWKEPEKFNPDRFLNEERSLLNTCLHPETFFTDKDSYKFVPFGQGRRRCVGYGIGRIVMWLKCAIWLHCFEWRSKDGVEMMDLKTEYLGITLVPEDQKVRAVPRPAARLLKPFTNSKVEVK